MLQHASRLYPLLPVQNLAEGTPPERDYSQMRLLAHGRLDCLDAVQVHQVHRMAAGSPLCGCQAHHPNKLKLPQYCCDWLHLTGCQERQDRLLMAASGSSTAAV